MAAKILREKARDAQLNQLAAKDRGAIDEALQWTTMAILLHEVANALDPIEEAA
jgi:hypothetical protein